MALRAFRKRPKTTVLLSKIRPNLLGGEGKTRLWTTILSRGEWKYFSLLHIFWEHAIISCCMDLLAQCRLKPYLSGASIV